MKDLYGIDLKKYLVTDWGYTNELSPISFERYEDWVNSGDAGDLKYLTDHRKDIRKSLSLLWPESKSALVFLFSYFSDKRSVENFLQNNKDWNGKKISGYVFGFEGEDYHHLLGQKLVGIGEDLKQVIPNLEYKIALDLHPNLDRDLAYRTGLGWYGKNSMFISKSHGSFTLIGSLILNQEIDLKLNAFETDHCGQCRRCIEACPTDAISDHRTIIVNKCISTFTIESFKEKPPPVGHDENSPWIFGCDICQDVCPWNKRLLKIEKVPVKELNEQQLKFINFFLLRPICDVYEAITKFSKKEYLRFFEKTPFERLGKNGMLKNLFHKNQE